MKMSMCAGLLIFSANSFALNFDGNNLAFDVAERLSGEISGMPSVGAVPISRLAIPNAFEFIAGTNKGDAVGAVVFDGDLILATRDGLYRQSATGWDYIADSGSGRPLTDVAVINGELIVVARDGLYKDMGKTFITGTNKGDAVGAVVFDGNLILATRDGLYRQSATGWDYITDSGSGRPLADVAVIKGGLIAVTRDGLYRGITQ